MKKSLYDVLGVKQNATQEDINVAYAGLKDKYQALRDQGDREAATQLLFLKDAHAILSDPTRRDEYDRKLAAANSQPKTPSTTEVSRLHPAFAVLAGLAGVVSLVMLWHLFGYAPPQKWTKTYAFTGYFTCCISWSFGVTYALVGLTLGWISQRGWPVALGMIMPLPIAFVIEVVQDRTSHNLIPFEIIMGWLPAFVVAFCGAYCGQLIRAGSARGATSRQPVQTSPSSSQLIRARSARGATLPMHEQDQQYAGFWIRVVAAGIDMLLLSVILLPLLVSIYGWAYFDEQRARFVAGPADFLISWILPAIAVIVFWTYRQATPGKMLVSIKIVDASTGNKPSAGQCVGRYLAYFVSAIPLGLGIFWIAIDKKKQRWHDKLANTVVVRSNKTVAPAE